MGELEAKDMMRMDMEEETYRICWRHKEVDTEWKKERKVFKGTIFKDRSKALTRVRELNDAYPRWEYFIETQKTPIVVDVFETALAREM